MNGSIITAGPFPTGYNMSRLKSFLVKPKQIIAREAGTRTGKRRSKVGMQLKGKLSDHGIREGLEQSAMPPLPMPPSEPMIGLGACILALSIHMYHTVWKAGPLNERDEGNEL